MKNHFTIFIKLKYADTMTPDSADKVKLERLKKFSHSHHLKQALLSFSKDHFGHMFIHII